MTAGSTLILGASAILSGGGGSDVNPSSPASGALPSWGPHIAASLPRHDRSLSSPISIVADDESLFSDHPILDNNESLASNNPNM